MGNPECVIAKHPKGFWMADVFLEGWYEGAVCDWYCTGKKRERKAKVIEKVLERFPDIQIVDGRYEE